MHDNGQRKKDLFWYTVILLAGLLVTGWGGMSVYRALVSSSWPVCSGYIVSSRVEDTARDAREGPSYSANIVYRYTVDGKQYTSDNVFFGQYNSGNPEGAQRLVKKYPAGKKVTVHYDPNQPSTAVLETGWSWGAFMLSLIGMVFLLAGIAGVWYTSTRRGNDTSPKTL